MFLHLIPSLLSSIVSAIVFACFDNVWIANIFSNNNSAILANEFYFGREGTYQGAMQFIGFLVSFSIGAGGGLIVGGLFRIWRAMNIP